MLTNCTTLMANYIHASASPEQQVQYAHCVADTYHISLSAGEVFSIVIVALIVGIAIGAIGKGK